MNNYYHIGLEQTTEHNEFSELSYLMLCTRLPRFTLHLSISAVAGTVGF